MIGIKLAYYRKNDWKRFFNMINDRESMHDPWLYWQKAYEKTKEGLINRGFEVNNIVSDLNEITEYCKLRGIINDGGASSQFVQAKQESNLKE